jgi:nucleoside-diphosphate-sugar epimerase
MAVLITGVAGFIGYNTANYFLDSGIDVIGVDSLSNLLYPKEIKQNNVNELSKKDNFTFYKMDLSVESLGPLIREVDTVINLAGLPGQVLSWSEFDEYQRANTLVVYNILKQIAKHPKTYFLQISSSSAQGNSSGSFQGNPISPYGVSKLAAENLVKVYANQLGLKTGILRLFSVFGPGQREDMAYAKFCNKIFKGAPISIYGDGKQARSNTYISDVSRAIFLSSLKQITNLHADVTSRESITLLRSIQIIAEEIGKEPVIQFHERQLGDQYESQGNASTLFELLGFQVETSIEAGLRQQSRDYLKKAAFK